MHGHLLWGETSPSPRCLACQVKLIVEYILLHCVSFSTNARDDFVCVTLTSMSELYLKVASRSIINFIKESGFYLCIFYLNFNYYSQVILFAYYLCLYNISLFLYVEHVSIKSFFNDSFISNTMSHISK